MNSNRGYFKLLVLVAAMQSVACSDVSFAPESASSSSKAEEFGVPYPDPSKGPGCFIEKFQQPKKINKKLDILIVSDTSGSIDAEKAEIANGIDSFVGQLPAGADYNIGVLLAHGSTGSQSGKLYSAVGESRVLKSSTMTLPTIRTLLYAKMTIQTPDYYSDGGELGMYSLDRLLQGQRLIDAKSLGLFREDAGLAVIFVSDENDICAVYPSGVTPVFDGEGLEAPAKIRDCGGITAQSVYTRLRDVKQGESLLVTGLIYTNPLTVPFGVENEVGYGYLDIIDVAAGFSVDLTGNIATGLAQIGLAAGSELNLILNFPLHSSNIDPASIYVSVDGQPVPNSYDAEFNIVHISESKAGGELSQIHIHYCDSSIAN